MSHNERFKKVQDSLVSHLLLGGKMSEGGTSQTKLKVRVSPIPMGAEGWLRGDTLNQ